MRMFAFIVGAAAAAFPCFARDKAPATPPDPVILGQVIDRHVAAVIPKFVTQRAMPAGQADRDWAIRNTGPSFGCFGYGGYYGYGYAAFGCGLGAGIGTFTGASIENGNSLP